MLVSIARLHKSLYLSILLKMYSVMNVFLRVKSSLVKHKHLSFSSCRCFKYFRNIPEVCAFHFVEIQSAFCLIFRTDWNFLIKFCSFHPSFNRNILRSIYLNFKTSAHTQIAITPTTCYLQTSWHDMNLKLTLGIHFVKWSWSMISLIWPRDFF